MRPFKACKILKTFWGLEHTVSPGAGRAGEEGAQTAFAGASSARRPGAAEQAQGADDLDLESDRCLFLFGGSIFVFEYFSISSPYPLSRQAMSAGWGGTHRS